MSKLGTSQDTGEFRNNLHKLIEEGVGIMRKYGKSFGNLRGKQSEIYTRNVKMFGSLTKSIQEKEQQNYQRVSSALNVADYSENPQQQGHGQQRQMQREDQQAIIAMEADLVLLEDRAVAIKNIAKDVVVINELMHDLRDLVEEQQIQIDTIGDNVAVAKDNILAGRDQLVKAADHQKKGRSKMCYLLLLLLLVLVALALGVWQLTKKK